MKAALIILDGLGMGPPGEENAVYAANTPVLDGLFKKYPHTTLQASGVDVGLPQGQMGNSEVGHLNIGAGRIIYQPLLRIKRDMENRSFFKREVVREIFDSSLEGKLHFLGLLSPGGVHSHSDHLKELLLEAKRKKIKDVYVHVFLDGRDTPPDSGLGEVEDLVSFMEKEKIGKIASISGRYYAMDRDQRWERIQRAYDVLVYGKGELLEPIEGLKQSYKQGLGDEFVIPFLSDPQGLINSGDRVVFFNFRPDRARELTQALTQKDFDEFNHEDLSLRYYTMSQYSADFSNVKVIYPQELVENTLGEILSKEGKKQYRTAETEKYPHITFFFNGSRESPFPGEDRLLVPSPKVATYDLMPEMSAYKVTRALVDKLKENTYDFYLVNFANPDMVGHTGNFDATKKAVEAVDQCLGELVPLLEEKGIAFIITADHGNAEEMILPASGEVSTQHSLNPVPFILGGLGELTLKEEGRLSDLAPTLLKILDLKQPKAMTGKAMF
ncbi:MAG TPA: 2,3-bisphosphoglycerate-independent phosphoglycerate mutase [Clostridia bacterium]|nr:2,3-bisphosphoglycerate-independent phosphoglycerate mutase [Clostridia bacterium]